MSEHEMIQVTGKISVHPAPEDLKDLNTRDVCLILLMGTTGSGKSSFVECIGSNRALGISKDCLDGVTQNLAVYRLNNATRIGGDPIFLIDTPGFSDDKITEASILTMVQSLLKENKLGYVDRILYFDRITDIRMTGGKGRCLEIFRAITGQATEQNITIVTTMWDQLWNERQIERANERFESLRKTHLNCFVDEGSCIVKFTNSHESALSSLRQCMESSTSLNFTFEHMMRDNIPVSNTKSGLLLYRNLLERRSALQQRIQHLEEGICENPTKDDAVRDILSQERDGLIETLVAIEQETKALGCPPGLDVIHSFGYHEPRLQALAAASTAQTIPQSSLGVTSAPKTTSKLRELVRKVRAARQIQHLVRQYK